jgi:hypothetical protein
MNSDMLEFKVSIIGNAVTVPAPIEVHLFEQQRSNNVLCILKTSEE